MPVGACLCVCVCVHACVIWLISNKKIFNFEVPLLFFLIYMKQEILLSVLFNWLFYIVRIIIRSIKKHLVDIYYWKRNRFQHIIGNAMKSFLILPQENLLHSPECPYTEISPLV